MKLVKPRFFIDMPSLAQSVGAISHSETVEGLGVNAYDLHFLNYKKPKTPIISVEENNQIMKMIFNDSRWTKSIDYFGMMAQTYTTNNDGNLATFTLLESYVLENNDETGNTTPNLNNCKFFNCELNGGLVKPLKTGGFLIRKANNYDTDNDLPITFFNHTDDRKIINGFPYGKADQISLFVDNETNEEISKPMGGITYGWHYTMPHSANLEYKYSVEYDGVDVTQTKGGNTLYNKRHTTGASYVDYPPYQIFRPHPSGLDHPEANSGRKVWDLTFSYISETDYQQDYSSGNSMWKWSDVEEGGGNDNVAGGWSGIRNDFTSRVLFGTQGYLPFVFQPDSEKDYYTVCSFDQGSFSCTQQAPDLWQFSCKIKETF